MAILRDLLDQITFNISETTDLNNKAANALFSNSNILKQLKFALDKYAATTLAYERVWSTQASTANNIISAPPRILRSQGIKFMMLFYNGFKFPMIDKDHSNVFNSFPVDDITGISTWFLYWGDQLQIYSRNSLDPLTANLSTAINAEQTTITLASTIAIPTYNGRVTIDGTEKIYYKYRSGATLYECERGAEDTTAKAHDTATQVKENNIHISYYSLYDVPVIPSDDKLTLADKNRVYLIPEEHIEPITDYASWKLLSKIDPGRAGFYKFNWDEWLEEARFQIAKGRSRISQTDDVREPFFFEQDQPFVGL